jgi:transposase-like protein
VWLYPGKHLEVLKLCCSGMTPKQACETVGANYSTLRRLREDPATSALLLKRACPVCGENVPPPLNRKYCSDKCKWTAKHEQNVVAKGIKRRFIDYEGRQKALELYQDGLDCGSIAQHLDVPKQKVKNWVHRSKVIKSAEISPKITTLRPLRRQLEDAQTAEEWSEILRNSEAMPELTDTVILVCARLHGSGAPGRYIGIASEQFWQEGFYDGVCVAFCNILKNAITTIEWRGENFHLTRTFKTSGTFVWPDEKLGCSIEVTRGEFERLISLKKYAKNIESPCIHKDF